MVELGDGLALADGDGVDVSDGEALAVADGDADADEPVAAGPLGTRAAVSTDVLGGDAQIVPAACGATAADAACARTGPKPRTMPPAAAHAMARLAVSVLTTASPIRSGPVPCWHRPTAHQHDDSGSAR
jgi:hypothetical protein